MLKKVKFFNSETGQWEIVAVAEKGDQGPKGDRGEPFTYEDFTEEQLEGLRGPQGIQGAQGEKGERGYHFTPSVDNDGNLEWTNDGDLDNPATVNIKGPKGDNGVFSKSISAIEIVPELPAEGEWVNGTLYIVVNGEGGE